MKSSHKKYGIYILLLTPVILAITECLLWFSNLNYDAVIGGWVSENKFSYFAVMCFYFLPFIRIIIETTGFIPALKNKMKLYSVLFSIEILLDLIHCLYSIREFYYALSI